MTALWTRANTLLLLLVLAALVALVAMAARDARGGPLDPPAAPASTDSVRLPGTPISALPFTINQPGSYYLTRNLTGAPGTTGVEILTSNVTLDLMGFTLSGTNGTGTGISVANGQQQSVRIRNGTVRRWFYGVDAADAVYSTVSDLSIINNGVTLGDAAFGLRIGIASRVHDCIVMSNTGNGIVTEGSVSIDRCTVADNGGNGVVLGPENRVTFSVITFNGLVVDRFDLRIDIGSFSYVTDSKLGAIRANTDSVSFARNCYTSLSGTGTPEYFPTTGAEANVDC
jgi:hypothetical protein